MVNYQKGKIYKIIDNTNNNVYVGSTCEKLCRRLQKHKSSYKCYLNPNVKQGHMRSFDIIKNGDFKIVLIEDYPCNNKEQLLSREQYFIDKIDCINHNNPIHESKEYQQKWRDNNREHCNQKSREWSKKNRDKKNEINRLYRYSVSINNINKIDTSLFLI
jgi:hypothetical protein